MAILSRYQGNLEAQRAKRTWARITERPATIIIARGRGTTLAAQVVRAEYSRANREKEESASVSNSRDIVIYGVIGHPDEDILDTNIQRNDRFTLNGQQWQIESVLFVPGGIQATGVVSA